MRGYATGPAAPLTRARGFNSEDDAQRLSASHYERIVREGLAHSRPHHASLLVEIGSRSRSFSWGVDVRTSVRASGRLTSPELDLEEAEASTLVKYRRPVRPADKRSPLGDALGLAIRAQPVVRRSEVDQPSERANAAIAREGL